MVGFLSTVDPNPGDTFTYSLVEGSGSTHNADFVIVEDTLQVGNNELWAGQYSIRVRSTDAEGLYVEKELAVEAVFGMCAVSFYFFLFRCRELLW